MAQFLFRPEQYGSIVAALLATPRISDLGPGTPDEKMRAALRAFDPMTALGNVRDRDAARACHAGLWLYFDFLEESHEISQSLDTSDGSFWHAIMHRREPDPSNAMYWFRRVGAHPVLRLLTEQAQSVGYTYENPQQFVDFCERVRDTGTPDEELAKRVQKLEWELLFDHCYRAAT